MIKDKIKEIEEKYDMWADDYNLDPQDVECLIKQAKLGIVQQEQFHDYQTQNLRLQERVRELEEKVEEQIESNWKKEGLFELLPNVTYYIDKLKEEIKNLERRLVNQIESNRMYMRKNKRYREQLELIRKDTFYEEHEFVSIRHLIRKRVDKALEGEE